MTNLICIFFQRYMQVFGPCFPIFGLNNEIYNVNLRFQSEYRKIHTRKNFGFGNFLCSDCKSGCNWTNVFVIPKFKAVKMQIHFIIFSFSVFFIIFLLVQVYAWMAFKQNFIFYLHMFSVGRNSIHFDYCMIVI